MEEGSWQKLSKHWPLCKKVLRKVAFAGLTSIFALCGSLIGLISGALKGHTTETGLFRGAGIGAIAGAIVSVDVLESCPQGEILSKLAIFDSLIDGKIFREGVSSALLKAYQWQLKPVTERVQISLISMGTRAYYRMLSGSCPCLGSVAMRPSILVGRAYAVLSVCRISLMERTQEDCQYVGTFFMWSALIRGLQSMVPALIVGRRSA